jgi:hypothetical protein
MLPIARVVDRKIARSQNTNEAVLIPKFMARFDSSPPRMDAGRRFDEAPIPPAASGGKKWLSLL